MDLCISCNPNPSSLPHFSPNKRINIKKRRGFNAKSQLTTVESNPTTSSSSSGPVPTHRVTFRERQRGVVHEFLVPEDQYIVHTAESQDITLPFACRHGCCTSCAVRVKSGEIRQPEALGISAELKSKVRCLDEIELPNSLSSSVRHVLPGHSVFPFSGYALLCVGFPSSDLEVETQDEDEVYWLQFGRYFARVPIERDDYALELAMGDE